MGMVYLKIKKKKKKCVNWKLEHGYVECEKHTSSTSSGGGKKS